MLLWSQPTEVNQIKSRQDSTLYFSALCLSPYFHKLTDRPCNIDFYSCTRVNIFNGRASDHGFPVLPLLYFRNLPWTIQSGSRLADHFSVILFRPACAHTAIRLVLCKLLKLSLLFGVACRDDVSLTSGKLIRR